MRIIEKEWKTAFSKSYIVFGWVDFRGMKNIGGKTWVFHCLAMRGKWEEWKTREKIFSLGPQNFFLPNWEEKQWGKTASRQFYLNALPFFFFQSDWTFFFFFFISRYWTWFFPFFFFFFFISRYLNVILSSFFFFFHLTWIFFFFSVTWAFRLHLNVFFFFPVTWFNFYIIII